MSLLKRFLGLDDDEGDANPAPGLQQIIDALEGMPQDRAHYLAAFACVLARVAHADLRIENTEEEAMRRATASLGNLSKEEAALSVDIAIHHAREHGGTSNYLITREFKNMSSREQRFGLVECLYAVSAADGSISTTEGGEVLKIAEELGLSRSETMALRAGWKEHLAEFQGLAKS
ncbi:MAG: TerB family tellurite resistance protein [bacterium]|nr:TerB family tellurite resistance protein [bacterium]